MAIFGSKMEAPGGENGKKWKGEARENETRRKRKMGEMRMKNKRAHVLTIYFFFIGNNLMK